jgi:diguanylate cyclase (GGDEF)-like protein
LVQHNGGKIAVLFTDLDGFKHINDSPGHRAGDKFLQCVANRLLDCVRASDTVSRQGGDEFLVVLKGIEEPEDAAVAAKRWLRLSAETCFMSQHNPHITASIGVSLYPDDGPDRQTLIKNEYAAMYQAKDGGRDIPEKLKFEASSKSEDALNGDFYCA